MTLYVTPYQSQETFFSVNVLSGFEKRRVQSVEREIDSTMHFMLHSRFSTFYNDSENLITKHPIAFVNINIESQRCSVSIMEQA